MLVLTQKEGEILQVGKDVRIFIKRIKGNWVRLCIDAPKEVELKRIPAPKVDDEDAAPVMSAPMSAAEELADTERRVLRMARRR